MSPKHWTTSAAPLLLTLMAACGPVSTWPGFVDAAYEIEVTNATGYDILYAQVIIEESGDIDYFELENGIRTYNANKVMGELFMFEDQTFSVTVNAIDDFADGYIWGPYEFSASSETTRIRAALTDFECCYSF